jgi:hypothetical protein
MLRHPLSSAAAIACMIGLRADAGDAQEIKQALVRLLAGCFYAGKHCVY